MSANGAVPTMTTKITPPAELRPRVVPRTANYTAVAHLRQGAVHAAVIEWKRLVQAVWQLGEDEQYTGELPPGLSSQQFWAKVTRQARALGGRVGVAVRGRQWWAWQVERGRMDDGQRWKRAIQRLQQSGECWFDGELSALDRKALREAARRVGVGRVRFVKGTDAIVGQTGIMVVEKEAAV